MEQDLGYQLAYQRGVQAVIWGMPAVSIATLRQATFRDLGARWNDIVYMSNLALPRHELLTPSTCAPYVMVMLRLKEGPVVLEVPPAGEAVAFAGTAIDGWMVPIADIGLWGEDAGAGAKYLFLPPGYQGDVPAGYLAAPSTTFAVHVALRAIPGDGNLADAVAYSKRLRAYPLSQAGHSPANRYIDAFPKTWRTLPLYDMSFFALLAEAIDEEPAQERDAAMLGLLASLGIRKGAPFLPEGRIARALELAVKDARRQMEHYFETPGLAMAPSRPGGHWLVSKTTPHDGGTFVTDGRLLVDDRAGGYSYWARFAPKGSQQASYSLRCLHDSSGQLLKGNHLYRLRVPRYVPARDFWSITVYGKDSKAFVYNDLDRVALSSRDRELRTSSDGSVEIYFGPQPLPGKQANWIPTGNCDFFVCFRLHGPERAVFDRSFKLADIERLH